jgi:hypothetical protein
VTAVSARSSLNSRHDHADLHEMTTFVVGKRWFAVLALVLGTAVAITLLVRYFRGPDRESYLAKNELIVVGLPRPRGAHEITRQMLANEESWGEQFSHTVGYSTHVSYAAPNAMSGESLVNFYKRRMKGLAPSIVDR